MASGHSANSAPAIGWGTLIEGPPLYRPVSAWGPAAAIAVTAIACFAPLAAMAAATAAIRIAGVSPENWLAHSTSLATPGGVATMALSQLLSLTIIWLAAGRGGLRKDTLRLAGPRPDWSVTLGVGVLLILISATIELIFYKLLGFDLFGDSKWLLEGLNSGMGWGVAIVAVILAPLWEEMAFRGFLLSALARSSLGFWPAAAISTALWTLLHWGYSLAGLLSVFAAGLLLSWLMLRLGSMRVVVVAHALANAVALTATYLFAPGQ